MPLPDDLPNLFSILEVVLRLRDHAPSFNRVVGGGLQFDHAKVPNADKHVPYAFVCPIDTVGKEIDRQGCFHSREAVLAIIICVDGKKHKAQADGENPAEVVHSFSPLIAEIENCLLSWKPAGFVLDGIPMFERIHPLGATESLAWVMLEYAIPFRYYNLAYGGGMITAIDDFNTKYPNYRADAIENLMVHYKGRGEFPTVVGAHFYDNIPFPVPAPDAEKVEKFAEESEHFNINEAVRQAIEERGVDAMDEVEQTQDVPFNHAKDEPAP